MNPGAFRYRGHTCLLLRVAERPRPVPGKRLVTLADGESIQQLEFDENDPALDQSDPRILRYAGQDYPTTLSHLRIVTSDDGVHFKESSELRPLVGIGESEALGIEDCRVAQIGSTYYLTYTQASLHGIGVGLRSTEDWVHFQHHGTILPPHNKDCALFEKKIDGRYFMLHRPSSPEFGGNYIWLAESPDLLHWGQHRCIAHTRPGKWDSARIGPGASPIKTDEGWLLVYHGASQTNRYCLGVMLLDLQEPWKVIARSEEPVMEPEADYEQSGFFGGVVFSNGHIADGDRLTVYYGASDTFVCSAVFSIRALLDSIREMRDRA
jgi:predicted GH43/DUF377 family glycosyl hydrolase